MSERDVQFDAKIRVLLFTNPDLQVVREYHGEFRIHDDFRYYRGSGVGLFVCQKGSALRIHSIKGPISARYHEGTVILRPTPEGPPKLRVIPDTVQDPIKLLRMAAAGLQIFDAYTQCDLMRRAKFFMRPSPNPDDSPDYRVYDRCPDKSNATFKAMLNICEGYLNQ